MKLLNDKRGLEFKSSFFAVIVVSLVIIAVGVIIGDWSDNYNSGLSYDLQDYNELDSITNEAEGQKGDISVKSSAASTVAGNTDFEGTSIRGVFGLLNNIYEPFRIVFGEGGMIDSVTDRWGIPDYIRQGIVTMMIMAITFALVAIFFRIPRRSA